MISQVNKSTKGELRMKWLSSLVPFILLHIALFSSMVETSPLNRIDIDSLKSKMIFGDQILRPDASSTYDKYSNDEKVLNSVKQLLNYLHPQLIHQQFVYNDRIKREFRSPRKIVPSPSTMHMPAYYPFIMAEMIPGSVKIRHPSIIAVNGCPSYYIADHNGICRQVFQFTVNFGERSPQFPQENQDPFVPSTLYGYPAPNPAFRPIPTPQLQPSISPPTSPRLVTLLRNAAKKFDLSFLNNQGSSTSSGEVNNEDEIDKLRKKILKALKITNNQETSKQNMPQNLDRSKIEPDVKTSTPDYDD